MPLGGQWGGGGFSVLTGRGVDLGTVTELESGTGMGMSVRMNGVAVPSGKGPDSNLLSRNSSTRVWHKV